MKNLLPWVLVALIAVLILLLFQERQPRQLINDRQIDSLTSVITRHQAAAAEAWMEMEFAQAHANALGLELANLQAAAEASRRAHHAQLQQLRSQPPVVVETTNIHLAECDSAIETGAQLQQENQLQAMQIIGLDSALAQCQRAYAHKDTAGLAHGSRFEACEQKNISLENELQKTRIGAGIAVLLFLAALVF